MSELTRRRTVRNAAAAAGASWLALVAATTIGMNDVDCVRAEVRGESGLPTGGTSLTYRLVVQCYAPESLRSGHLDSYARPLGSVQRAVTAEELQRGIAVDVLQFGEEGRGKQAMVIAWVEPGEPTLEFDAMLARPTPGAVVGMSESYEANAQIVLRRAA